MYFIDYSSSLAHHGVKGMKWGVRNEEYHSNKKEYGQFGKKASLRVMRRTEKNLENNWNNSKEAKEHKAKVSNLKKDFDKKRQAAGSAYTKYNNYDGTRNWTRSKSGKIVYASKSNQKKLNAAHKAGEKWKDADWDTKTIRHRSVGKSMERQFGKTNTERLRKSDIRRGTAAAGAFLFTAAAVATAPLWAPKAIDYGVNKGASAIAKRIKK